MTGSGIALTSPPGERSEVASGICEAGSGGGAAGAGDAAGAGLHAGAVARPLGFHGIMTSIASDVAQATPMASKLNPQMRPGNAAVIRCPKFTRCSRAGSDRLLQLIRKRLRAMIAQEGPMSGNERAPGAHIGNERTAANSVDIPP